jgi:hypothetical protein
MPHHARSILKLNDVFGRQLTDEELGIVNAEGTLRQKLSELDILTDIPEPDVDTLFSLLGESVQAAILAAMRSAASRQIPLMFNWQPSRYASMGLFEAVDSDGVGVVGCTVKLPWLRDAGGMQS